MTGEPPAEGPVPDPGPAAGCNPDQPLGAAATGHAGGALPANGAHSHQLTATGGQRRPLAIALLLSLAIGAAEVTGAVLTGSLVLFADAAHMAADAAAIGLSLLAAWFARRPATSRRTFGYARAEILAALANALLLLGMAGVIFAEAASRLVAPPGVGSGLMIAFGAAALVANACSLLVLRHGRTESLNVRAAFLEVAADAAGAGAVVLTGIVIAVTGFLLADPIASITVAALILPRTWRLLREATDVLLEASPEGIDLDEIREHMSDVPGVREVHDMHVWTITSGLPVFSAHVVVDPAIIEGGRTAATLDRLQACLLGHFDVGHSTVQLEPAGHAEHERPMHG